MKGLSKEEVLEIHQSYATDTDQEGKYIPIHSGYPRYATIMELVPKQAIVLDVGCNSGGMLFALMKDKEIIPYGIDVNKDLLEKARIRGCFVKEASVEEELPYRMDFFDVCIAADVLEHLYSDIVGMENIMRVLKPGGIFIATVPHPKGYSTLRRPPEKHLYHTRSYTVVSFRKLLKKYLKQVQIKTVYDLYCSPYYKDEIRDRPRWMVGWGYKK